MEERGTRCYVCSSYIKDAKQGSTKACSFECLVMSCSYQRDNGCWEYFRSIKYKRHTYSGVSACKKIVYQEFVGEVEEGMFIKQTCKNKQCINPEHLLVITLKKHLGNLSKKQWERKRNVSKGKYEY